MKVAFFCVVGVHVAAIVVALLAQGCKREQPPVQEEAAQPLVPEMVDTNPIGTNLPSFDANAGITAPPTNYIPPTLPPDVAPVAPATQEYTIQKGDTFSTIAPKFHVTVKALQAANPNVDPARLQIGKIIVIPPPTTSVPGASTTGATASSVESPDVYIVKSGDTLTKIASDHKTTVSTIKRLNNLSTDRITVGQKLKMPAAGTPAPQ